MGFLAPFVAVELMRRARPARPFFLGFTVLGILDFVVAPAMGLVTNIGARGVLPDGTLSEAPVHTLPLSLIPTFAVPFVFVVHLLSPAAARRSS